MFSFYKQYLEGNNYFHIMIVFSFIVIMSNVVTLVMHFYFYGGIDQSNGLYLNLTPSPDNATCSNYPFAGHYPLEISYITDNGKYSYACTLPQLYLILGHGVISGVVILLTLISFFTGTIYVHWSSVVLVLILFLSNLMILAIGISDELILESALSCCEHDLFHLIDFSKSSVKPLSLECSDGFFKQFANYEIFAGLFGLIYLLVVFIIYLCFRGKKKELFEGYKEQMNNSNTSDHSEINMGTVIDSSNESSEINSPNSPSSIHE